MLSMFAPCVVIMSGLQLLYGCHECVMHLLISHCWLDQLKQSFSENAKFVLCNVACNVCLLFVNHDVAVFHSTTLHGMQSPSWAVAGAASCCNSEQHVRHQCFQCRLKTTYSHAPGSKAAVCLHDHLMSGIHNLLLLLLLFMSLACKLQINTICCPHKPHRACYVLQVTCYRLHLAFHKLCQAQDTCSSVGL